MLTLRRIVPALAVAGLVTSPTLAVQFIGAAQIVGSADPGIPSVVLENGVDNNNSLNGFGSAIAYTGVGNRYVFLPDRGPNATPYAGGASVDNTVSWNARYNIFDLSFTPAGGGTFNVGNSFVGTALFRNDSGQALIGKSNAFVPGSPNNPVNNARIDPEGIRVGANGEVYVSDEYGPVVYRFDQNGLRTGVFNVPDHYTLANPSSNASVENAGGAASFAIDPRRVTNRGMESLAISPDGTKLFGLMQTPLQQDGGTTNTRVRLLQWDTANPTGTPAEFVYQLDASNRVISEFVAINDHEFLVVERDQLAGTAASFKKIFKIDLNGATSVTGTADLDNIAAATPVQKSLFIDLISGAGIDATSFSAFKALLTGATVFDLFPEKVEGITFGPPLPDGRQVMLVTNDNDFLGAPNYVFAFALDPNELAVQAQQFAPGLTFEPPVPEPTTAVIGLAALGLLGRKRRSA